jgi:hypothetical protein
MAGQQNIPSDHILMKAILTTLSFDILGSPKNGGSPFTSRWFTLKNKDSPKHTPLFW